MPREAKRQRASSPKTGSSSSEQPPKKRATPARPGASSSTVPSVNEMVATLDVQTLRSLIIRFAPANPDLTEAVRTAHRARPSGAVPLSQMRPIVDFDHYSKEAWRAYDSRKGAVGAKQSEAATDAYLDIYHCIAAIGGKTTDASPLQTKQSAVETLRKIAKTIAWADDEVGREMRELFASETKLPDIMVQVLESMTPEQRIATGQRTDAKGSLHRKVQSVMKDLRDVGLPRWFETLQTAVEMLDTGRCVIHL